jgi:hypothetical protein
VLASNLLTLHLLAPEEDKLTELLPPSAKAVLAGLTAADKARQLQLQPLFQASAAAAGQGLSSSSSSSNSDSQHASSSNSSSKPPHLSSSRSGSGAQPPDLSSSSCGGGGSSSSSIASSTPSLFHLAMQHRCFGSCPPQQVQPWLQLLSIFHALAGPQLDADTTSQYNRQRREVTDPATGDRVEGTRLKVAVNLNAEPEASLAAAVVALRSFSRGHMPTNLLQLGIVAQQLLQGTIPLMPLGLPLQLPLIAVQQQQDGAGASAASTQQQQQKLADCCFASHDQLAACVYWMHGERLLAVSPDQWPKIMAAAAADAAAAAAAKATAQSCARPKRSSSSGSGGGGGQQGAAAASAAAVLGGCDVTSLQLLADMNCDWCNGPVPHSNSSSSAAASAAASDAESAAATGGSAGQQQQQRQKQCWGCASCSNAQYCSEECAAAGNKVHGPNCWCVTQLLVTSFVACV